MEIVLIRHTSVDVPQGVCYGQTDVPLRETFEEEAAVCKQKLSLYEPFDKVYCSPLSRCTRLAAYCGHADAVRDERLLEINLGEWEMQYYEKITDPRLNEWYQDFLHTAATGGESFMQQYRRVADFLDGLRREPHGRTAIFTHGGVIACAQTYAGVVRLEDVFKTLAPYGEVVPLQI